MDLIKEVDLREALMEIAQNNTHTHLNHDINISYHQMERAAKLMQDDPEENTLIWVSYPFGIDCYTERDVFQEGTRSYNGLLYHAEMTRDRQLVYAVEITEEKDGRIGGNLYELDIKEYGAAVRAQALPSDLVRVYTGEDYGGEFVMPRQEFDGAYPNIRDMTYYRAEPENSMELQHILTAAQEKRLAECAERSLWSHTSRLYDSRKEFYTDRILADLGKLPDANAHDGQSFAAVVEYNCLSAFGPANYEKLLEALPFEHVAFTFEKGARDMQVVVPRDEVLQYRQAQQQTERRNDMERRTPADMLEILETVADQMVREGCVNTTGGNWSFDFSSFASLLPADDVQKYQKAICDLLAGREEVADVDTAGGYFDVTYYTDFCPNYEGEAHERKQDAEREPKPSILAQLEESRKAAQKAAEPPKSTPNMDMEREV